VVAQFAPQAHRGGRGLALTADTALVVEGHPVLLELALRNLVENSLSHTPPGTHVEVEVDEAQHCIRVCDVWPPDVQSAGPEQADDAALGLRLGHRVVQKIAAIHGAHLQREELGGGRVRCHAIVFA
jgi:two-component system sensor histidine kinase QseC